MDANSPAGSGAAHGASGRWSLAASNVSSYLDDGRLAKPLEVANRPLRRLITIPISHYCEKARWALERAALPYREEAHIQMLHWPHAWLAGRSKTVPVLVEPDRVLTDSSDILRSIDVTLAEPLRLYPADMASEIGAYEDELDDGFGVATRRRVYAWLSRPGARRVLAYNNATVPWWENAAMRGLFPIARAALLRYLDVTEESVAAATVQVAETLDAVAKRLEDGRPFLFGDRFTAADLTFAAMAAPVVLPPNYGVRLPSRAEAMEHDPSTAQFWEHPAIVFATRLFAEHRNEVVGTPSPDEVGRGG